jgi:AAA domain
MSTMILVIGDSGTGKSTSLRNLKPEETFILNVINKPLPFKGANKKYTRLSPDGATGNIYSSDEPAMIRRVINLINDTRPKIKNLVIDDFGYTIMNDFMRKALVKGYDKYSEIGKTCADTLEILSNLREDLNCIVMMHIETDKQGKTKPKTVGNMIDQYVCIEGKFTYVFHTIISDGRYLFIVNNDGHHMAKSSLGLFNTLYIDNDLDFVIKEINNYSNEDISI